MSKIVDNIRNGHKWCELDDLYIRTNGGKIAVAYMAEHIGCTMNALHNRASKLKVSVRFCKGENHQGAKLSNLQVAMIHTLHSGGFTAREIYEAMCFNLPVTANTVESICYGEARYKN